MSVRSQAVADAQAILTADGEPVTLTAPVSLGSTVYSLHGLYNRVGVDVNAEGLTVLADKSTLGISLAALMTAGLADVEDLKKPGWTVSVLDALGVAVPLRIDTVMLDRTLGVAAFTLKKVES